MWATGLKGENSPFLAFFSLSLRAMTRFTFSPHPKKEKTKEAEKNKLCRVTISLVHNKELK